MTNYQKHEYPLCKLVVIEDDDELPITHTKKQEEVITLTFGDMGENHVGMEKIGDMVEEGEGFTFEDLNGFDELFTGSGLSTEMYDLTDLMGEDKQNVSHASVLVVRKGVEYFLNGKTDIDVIEEMDTFEWDNKYFDTRRNKVLNKIARTNVCFRETSQEPDYENKQGRIVAYDDVECVKAIRDGLSEKLGAKCENLICEGNRYYNLKKCGIGYHGDSERRKVIACRLGGEMDLHFHWFLRSEAVGDTLELHLESGDMYFMSEKAVGTDWKRRNVYTLRHSAGKAGVKYLKIQPRSK
jgi:hypothetical protein